MKSLLIACALLAVFGCKRPCPETAVDLHGGTASYWCENGRCECTDFSPRQN